MTPTAASVPLQPQREPTPTVKSLEQGKRKVSGLQGNVPAE